MLSNQLLYSDNLGNTLRKSCASGCHAASIFEGISLKFVATGSETYFLGKRSFRVPRNTFLLSNFQGQASVVVDEHQSAQGVCVALTPELVEEVARTNNWHRHPAFDWLKGTWFANQMHANLNAPTHIRLQKLASVELTDEHIEEELFGLAEDLIAEQIGVHKAWSSLSFAKPLTRSAVFESLLRVKALIDAQPGETHSLDDLATFSALSKYRLIRLFKEAFGTTPMKYAAQQRMIWAAAQLSDAASVAEVAYDSGYSDRTAFSRAFRKALNQSPASLLRK